MIQWIEGNRGHCRPILYRYHIVSCHDIPDDFFVLVFRSFVISFLWLIYQYFTFSSVTSSHWLTLGVNQYFSMERLLIYFCVIYTLIYSYSKSLIFPYAFLWIWDLSVQQIPEERIYRQNSTNNSNFGLFLSQYWYIS